MEEDGHHGSWATPVAGLADGSTETGVPGDDRYEETSSEA